MNALDRLYFELGYLEEHVRLTEYRYDKLPETKEKIEELKQKIKELENVVQVL